MELLSLDSIATFPSTTWCGANMTKVKRLLRMCGINATALYLKNRGYTPEQAITLMFR
jgi:hypothetical protein